MRVARVGWAVAGLACVAVGGIGIVVPGLPTTVFFIAAAWCFSRSSPRLEAWVLNLKGVGPMVRDYRAGLGMPRRAKFLATASIVVFAGIAVWFALEHPAIRGVVGAAGLVGIGWIWWRVPTREDVVAQQGVA